MISNMYILLDLDGVLVPAKNWKTVELMDDGFMKYDEICSNNIQSIIDKTGSYANVILISSHRELYSSYEWIQIFEKRGIFIKSFYKLGKSDFKKNRKEEVLEWLENKNPNLNYVIIDDCTSLNGLSEKYKYRLVSPKSMIGLTKEDANIAIKILINKSVF